MYFKKSLLDTSKQARRKSICPINNKGLIVRVNRSDFFSNFQEWLPQPRAEIRKSPICSQVHLTPYCFKKKDRFSLNTCNTATVKIQAKVFLL